ncbi:MAG TPA: N-6 DNA methylase [Phycisphaerales bacterium]|nr:N-6 DNA methylase [Phycisphaerales bacterium]HMP38164.1 N-6 DNA methylase [Phycisphaerales bacterium]
MTAKRSTGKAASTTLFRDPDPLAQRRRRKPLFLPKLLARAGSSKQLRGEDFDRARTILARWAGLDESGKLAVHKETALDANFINEVLGDALGYVLNTAGTAHHDLEHKLTVPDCGTADAAIGQFPSNPPTVAAVIEFKDAETDLDRDRFNGRTAVQQLWDYLAALPACPWGILSNFRTIRLYHRDHTPRCYEEFRLRDLLGPERFGEFYSIFERGGLLTSKAGARPRALELLDASGRRQMEVGDKLYSLYSEKRRRLIRHLHRDLKKPLDRAIHIAQRIIDRIVFIAFCEDRGLLPSRTIDLTYRSVPPFPKARNPRWRNFVELFQAIDRGHPNLDLPTGYNGGLFAAEAEIDELDLDDDDFADFFRQFGDFDFRDEVNVDVLGNLFERSINELERLRVGEAFTERAAARRAAAEESAGADAPDDAPARSAMRKSAQRKLFGIYYTPPEFTSLIVRATIHHLAEERWAALAATHGVEQELPESGTRDQRTSFWRDAAAAVRSIRVCDPACGSGAFLIRAYDAFEELYQRVVDGLAEGSADDARALADAIPDLILGENLFGVDVSPEAVEITQLALWIRSARIGRTLADLDGNIVCGNSLVDDPAAHPRSIRWEETFPAVFASGGFDCVIGNPPWERVKVQEREFFATHDATIAQAVSAAKRRELIARLPKRNPALFAAYEAAKADADRMLKYARGSGRYPFTGRGDINFYTLFAELAARIVAPTGIVGLLTPSGIATDETTKGFFRDLVESKRLARCYDFENRRKVFPDVDSRFKFSATVFGGPARQVDCADFVFFAHALEDLDDRRRHIELGEADFKLFNPNTRTCPIFRTRRDAEITRHIYRQVPVLVDRGRANGGNPWSVSFRTMFHQTNDAEKFVDAKTLKAEGFTLDGNRWSRGRGKSTETFLPVYEAKMVQAYDHRAASVEVTERNWMRQGQKAPTSDVEHQNPEFVVQPRFWASEADVVKVFGGDLPSWLIGFKDITSPTNERTMLAAMVPQAGFTNHLILVLSPHSARRQACLLANFNAMVLDYSVRQKLGGVTLNFFIVEQLPVLPPDVYDEKCPWSRRTPLESWIADRVLRLTCTSNDMVALAEECGFAGSLGGGVHRWRSQEREELRAELDAAYFMLYGIDRDDVEHILDSFTTTRRADVGGDQESDARRRSILAHFDRLLSLRDRPA